MKKQKLLITSALGILLVTLSLAILVLFPGALVTTLQKIQGKPTSAELLAIENKIPTQAGKANFLKQSENLTKNVDPELVDLDSQIITCGASVDSLLSQTPSFEGSCLATGGTLQNTKGLTLGGQCCGTLTDTKEYHERLKKLQAYKNMPDIILDPMHTPVALAKKWIDYDNSTTLTSEEQKIYDQAYEISEEKPCCCKCWHYYVNEGIAKKMIKNKAFNSKQIADFWDDSEICGT